MEANFAIARAYILTGEFEKAKKRISFVRDDVGYKIKSRDYNAFVNIYERTKEFNLEGPEAFEKFLDELKEDL